MVVEPVDRQPVRHRPALPLALQQRAERQHVAREEGRVRRRRERYQPAHRVGAAREALPGLQHQGRVLRQPAGAQPGAVAALKLPRALRHGGGQADEGDAPVAAAGQVQRHGAEGQQRVSALISATLH